MPAQDEIALRPCPVVSDATTARVFPDRSVILFLRVQQIAEPAMQFLILDRVDIVDALERGSRFGWLARQLLRVLQASSDRGILAALVSYSVRTAASAFVSPLCSVSVGH